jgi:hypothetical protein
MVIAQNAALGAHTFVPGDGPELPKERGPHAESGGEVLEVVYAPECRSLEDAQIRSGMARDEVTGSQRLGIPFPSDNEDSGEMTYDQASLI